MAKGKEGWQKGQGPFSGIDKDSTPQPGKRVGFGTGNPRDISRIVDENSERNGGFPAPLKPDRK
jgi:hypothetical protein